MSNHVLSAAAQLLFKRLTLPPHVEVLTRATARILEEWGADDALVAAGYLHEIVHLCVINDAEVHLACGERVASLCAGYRALLDLGSDSRWSGAPAMRYRTRIYAIAYQDVELALLCVAHLWSTLFSVVPAQADASTTTPFDARTAQQILPPVLEMMGLGALRAQFDQTMLEKAIASSGQVDARQSLLEAVRRHVTSQLAERTTTCRLSALSNQAEVGTTVDRAGQQLDFDVSVTATNDEDCYLTLARVHRHYRPIDGAVVDTVRNSRINGFRGLQTGVIAVIDGRSVRLNVQIFTPAMAVINYWGVAAPCLHTPSRLLTKMAARTKNTEAATDPYAQVWWRNAADGAAQIASAEPGSALANPISVFSPLGELFEFPRGSTVVDFAYQVHTDLAEQCHRFIVNGEAVEPATVLRHLDLVELEIDPRAVGPTAAWLNAARTKRARARIGRQLRRHGQGASDGRRVVDRRLQEMEEYYGFHIAQHRVDEVLAREARGRNQSTPDELLAAIARGTFSPDRLLHPLFEAENIRRLNWPRSLRLRHHQIVLAQCCKPRPGMDIVGHPYRRNGIVTRLTIHTRQCVRFANLAAQLQSDPVEVHWRLTPMRKILAQLEVTARDDDWLLGEALAQVYSSLPHIFLRKVDATTRRGMARMRFDIEADNQETLDEVVDGLRRLPSREISAVRQLTLPPSEQDSLLSENDGISNPYNRYPVNEREMFFGRASELERINEWLRNNVNCIWLRGQKRVGKTSLLLHLKQFYFESHETVCAFVDLQAIGNLEQSNLFYEIAASIFADLQADPRIVALGMPNRARFDAQPTHEFTSYVAALQRQLDTRRLLLLLDEFSVTADAFLQRRISSDFFRQWRAVMQATRRACGYIAVMQQKTYDNMRLHMADTPDEPCWQMTEFGEMLALRPLEVSDAQRLIEWPLRNFLEFAAGTTEQILHLTGGSPYLIQVFCRNLVMTMARQGGRCVEMADVVAISEEFMRPDDNTFAHLLDLIRGVGNHVADRAAQLAARDEAGEFSWEQMCDVQVGMDPDKLGRTLAELCRGDILIQAAPNRWRFASALFQRWLERHPL